MSPLDLTNHLLNFVAPALFMAVVLAVATRFLMKKRAGAPALWAQVVINFMAGVAVLAAGLAWYGRDGMIMTYAALVAVCGTGQWLLAGGWRVARGQRDG
jgi:hypothetical protein